MVCMYFSILLSCMLKLDSYYLPYWSTRNFFLLVFPILMVLESSRFMILQGEFLTCHSEIRDDRDINLMALRYKEAVPYF